MRRRKHVDGKPASPPVAPIDNPDPDAVELKRRQEREKQITALQAQIAALKAAEAADIEAEQKERGKLFMQNLQLFIKLAGSHQDPDKKSNAKCKCGCPLCVLLDVEQERQAWLGDEVPPDFRFELSAAGGHICVLARRD